MGPDTCKGRRRPTGGIFRLAALAYGLSATLAMGQSSAPPVNPMTGMPLAEELHPAARGNGLPQHTPGAAAQPAATSAPAPEKTAGVEPPHARKSARAGRKVPHQKHAKKAHRAAARPAARHAAPPTPPVLIGVMNAGGAYEAMVSYAGKVVTVAEGQRIGGVAVTDINSTGARLNGQRQDLSLQPMPIPTGPRDR